MNSSYNEKRIFGNINEFHGKGCVAFIDILGFSAEIKNNWNNQENNPLHRLIKIKNEVVDYNNNLDTNSKEQIFACRVQTISDSFVVSFGVNDSEPYSRTLLNLIAFFDYMKIIWRRLIEFGFTVRGAIEYGDIFWNQSEIIGPAFIDAYKAEENYAKSSRIILQSTFNKFLCGLFSNPERTLNNYESLFFEMITKDIDGYLILNPHSLYKNNDELDNNHLIGLLEEMRDRNDKQLIKNKYAQLLAFLSSEKNNISYNDLGKY